MSALHQLVADVELVAILTVGGSAWLLWKGPRAIRRMVGRWLGTRRDANDRVYEEYRRRQVAEAKEAFKRESHTF